ncbi:enoyl-CoA hydratase / long-chain 3-hydroxyacyl-CoA dehydrogenase [Fistulifera solaris]|uniref:enoyl-CoA hydratase n=1 Tax=Fistulifera solaris TaxID=1519565 RepID=A0A1Z5KP73_FISSO|nr:enoyl-CoA hydratase / long-chain 3-hydroxyacyl-CoA dehydrogenase [Fistulifera solaris]|eukprot:GAX27925.1 enoyl-CoA hydratase / long-chain 3-hydroxyacyl-CoA dehydrogenase [Fistulifera solaris]
MMITRAAVLRHVTRRAILATSARITPTAALTSFNEQRFQSTAVAAESTSRSSSLTPSSSIEKKPFVATPERQYEFFRNVEINDQGVALIQFDCPGKSVNTISFAFAKEAQQLWQTEIHNNSNVKAVVFTSAKPNMFIAGADIFDIKQIENKQDLIPLIQDGVEFFQSWKKEGLPLVAAIDGPALGGGLEWALWCDYRVCSDSSKTKLGLPEVKLGLLPGFGGTQNLPATVGLQNAMDMMLTGKEIRPDKAKKMGLVDLVVAPASLRQAALDAAAQLATGKLKPKKKPKSWMNRLLEDTSMGRSVIWNQIDKMVKKNTDGHYPAPFSIIQCVQYGLENPAARFKNEREQFSKLAATPESQALIGLFEGTTALKKQDEQFKVPNLRKVDTVAVLGAGLMGAGIAQVTAEKCGYSQILLKDRNDEAVARGQAYLYDNWTKKVQKKRMSDYQRNKNFSSVVPLTDTTPSWKQHFSKADVIIEAVFEDLTLKQKIVADMEAVTPDHCVFATNTSAIPIRDIAANAKRPENIIGMHYFSPVPNMPLLEIIPHEGTSDETKAIAFNVGTKQGKTCIVVKDVPGFYVNRCLGPYLVEVSALVRDGVPLEQLDKSIKNFGMPVGPVTLADEVGVDVTSHVAKFLSNADLGVRMTGGDVTLMEKMVAKGWLGKKSGQGFYTYGKGKNAKKTISPEVQSFVKQFATQKLTLDEKEIQDRIVSRFVNEAAKCLEDGVIADPVVGDIGLVFGTGFAPFRGGPFRYLDQVGVAKYVDMMNGCVDKYGPQFEPCQLMKDYAATNKKFHN